MGKPQKMIAVSTSWDDGDRSDLRVAEMLSVHGLKGTFYIPIEPFPSACELGIQEIRHLATSFEIGGHTLSHRSLTELPYPDQEREVVECKRILENQLGSEVRSFCYPNGRLNRETVRVVERAGYLGARTTRMLRSSFRFPRFEMPTTLQAFPHPPQAYLRNAIKGRNLAGLARFAVHLRRARTWVDIGKALFDQILEEGGIWHIYGHSWELERLNLWGQLEELLGYVARRPGVCYLTNAEVSQLLSRAEPCGTGL